MNIPSTLPASQGRQPLQPRGQRPIRWAWLFAVLALASAQAATVTWDGEAGDGNWHTAQNWTGDAVPSLADDVVIESSATVEVLTTATVHGFHLAGGATLRVIGVSFRTEGPTVVDSANFYALSGAVVALPASTELNGPSACCGTELVAEGAGSTFDLSSVTLIDGRYTLRFASRSGGLINLKGVSELSTGYVELRAEGDGSRLEATNLVQFNNGALSVVGNAILDLPKLGAAGNVGMSAQSGGMLSLSSLARLAGPAVCCGRELVAEGPGSLLDLPALTSLDGGYALSFTARQGGQVKLNGLAEKTLGYVKFLAEGTGSRLEGANLANFAKGEFNVVGDATLHLPILGSASDVAMSARAGGKVHLASLARLAGPAVCCGAELLADGPGSLLNLSSVTFLDGGYTSHFLARHGGQVMLNSVETKTLGHVRLWAEGTGSQLEATNLLEFSNGDFGVVDGGFLNLPQLGAATNLSMYARGGGQVSFPSLTRLTGPAVCCGTELFAEGTGSLLDLSSIALLDGAYTVHIAARQGGHVKLNGVENKDLGYVRLTTDGAGSRLEATNLRRFVGGEFGVVGESALDLPKLETAGEVAMSVRGGGVFHPTLLTRLFGPAACCGAEVSATGIGSVLNLSSVTTLEGGYTISFRATEAGRILLPFVPVVTMGTVRILADGEGSLADFSSLRALMPSSGSSVAAAHQGVVALPADFDPSGVEITGATLGIVFPVAPQIEAQPTDQTVPLSSTATFTVIATGTAPITYRWQIEATQNNWQDIPQQTSPSLAIPEVSYGKEGRYRCILVNVGGLVISRAAHLRVGTTPPLDADGDGLLDEFELRYWGNLTATSGHADAEGDGLTNAQEYQLGTDPTKKDTDGDGFNDLIEVRRASNPLDPGSMPPPTLEIFVQQVRVEFVAPTGQSFMIQGSPDLVAWANLEQVAGTGDVVSRIFEVTEAHRYFRVIKL